MTSARKTRFLRFAVLPIVVGLSGPVIADSELTATFLGNQAFRITDGETILFTDFPYESGAYGYMTWEEELLQPVADSYCLITHEHRDHFAAELVERLGCTVVGPPSVVALLEGSGVVADNEVVALGPLTITPLDTPHNVEHRSYRVKWGEVSLYFTGDTETVDTLAEQEPLDVLFSSPWMFDSTLRRDALPTVGQVVIYHHRQGQVLPACRACEGEADCTPCLVPSQGQTFTLYAGGG